MLKMCETLQVISRRLQDSSSCLPRRNSKKLWNSLALSLHHRDAFDFVWRETWDLFMRPLRCLMSCGDEMLCDLIVTTAPNSTNYQTSSLERWKIVRISRRDDAKFIKIITSNLFLFVGLVNSIWGDFSSGWWLTIPETHFSLVLTLK